MPSRIYDVPIEELELSVRAYNCLKRAGITKVGEVLERLEKGEDEILAIRNFGRKSLNELVEKLERQGLPVGDRLPARALICRDRRRRRVRGRALAEVGSYRDETWGCRTQTGPQRQPAQSAVARPDYGAVPARTHQHDRG